MQFFEEIANGNKDLAFLEAASLEVSRNLLAYETILKKEELMLREKECKCILEGGDFDTLCLYYEDAAQATADSKDGALSKLWQSIVNLFRSIKTKLFGTKQTPPDKMRLPKPLAIIVRGISNAWSGIKGIFSNLKDGITNLPAIGKFALFLASAGGGAWAIKSIAGQGGNNANVNENEEEEVTKSEVESAQNTLEDMADTTTAALNKGENSVASGNFTFIKELGDWVKKVQGTLVEKIKAAGGAVKDAASNVKDKITGKGKEDENNQEGDQKDNKDGQNGKQLGANQPKVTDQTVTTNRQNEKTLGANQPQVNDKTVTTNDQKGTQSSGNVMRKADDEARKKKKHGYVKTSNVQTVDDAIDRINVVCEVEGLGNDVKAQIEAEIRKNGKNRNAMLRTVNDFVDRYGYISEAVDGVLNIYVGEPYMD